MKAHRIFGFVVTGATLIGAAALAGCSSVQPPREQLARADLAVRQAQNSKAPQHAALELRLAADKEEKARQAMRNEDYVLARRLAEQALVDAQLAESKAQSIEARQTARQLRDSIEALRREAERAGRPG